MKIITIVGARPQFIKAAPMSTAIDKYNKTCHDADRIDEIIIHTGQHFDKNMSDIFFEQLGIPQPKYNFGINDVSHGAMTARILERTEAVLINEAPDIVIVYGDTNSTLAGALAASKLHIPIAHIEAGLRSFNRQMPEEINRVITDHISDLLFCPTFQAVEHLKNEGITKNVFHVGDVMYDAALQAAQQVTQITGEKDNPLVKFGLEPDNYFLATVHRAENTDYKQRLYSILIALTELNKQKKVVFPMHPRTADKISIFGFNDIAGKLNLIEPVSFLDMVCLEKNASIILTDSGGVQKEAYFHSVPCITLRDETEWTETVDAGWNILAGAETNRILLAAATQKKTAAGSYIAEYGNGRSAKKILNCIMLKPWSECK